MKLYLDCCPCLLRQTIQAYRYASVSEKKQVRIISEVMSLLQTAGPSSRPP